MGVVRASLAYEFYTAVRDHCKLKCIDKPKWEKPAFEATSYQLYYCASDEDDARGKEDCHMILHREKDMWNCTTVEGCHGKYDFSAIAEVADGDHNEKINMRFLPCPCWHCFRGNFGECLNEDIVGILTESKIMYTAPTIVPVELCEPLEKYTVAVLKGYIKRHDIHVRKGRHNKSEFIDAIRTSKWRDNFREVNNNVEECNNMNE